MTETVAGILHDASPGPDTFYDSRAWKEVRYKALKFYGRKCMLCGNVRGQMHVDHIKPRSKFPELELDVRNLQILCADCNIGKGNSDSIDWRPPTTEIDEICNLLGVSPIQFLTDEQKSLVDAILKSRLNHQK